MYTFTSTSCHVTSFQKRCLFFQLATSRQLHLYKECILSSCISCLKKLHNYPMGQSVSFLQAFILLVVFPPHGSALSPFTAATAFDLLPAELHAGAGTPVQLRAVITVAASATGGAAGVRAGVKASPTPATGIAHLSRVKSFYRSISGSCSSDGPHRLLRRLGRSPGGVAAGAAGASAAVRLPCRRWHVRGSGTA